MKRFFSVILAVMLIAALVPAVYADEMEIEPIYDSYGLGEEIFICGTARGAGVSIMLVGPSGDYMYMTTVTAAMLAEGVYLGINSSWELGEYTLSVSSGGNASIFNILVVKDRVDHNTATGTTGSKNQVTATDVALSQTELELKVGESAEVTVTGEKSVFKWTSDNMDKITISSETAATTTITAKKTGTAVVWVYCGNNYATLNITILPADKKTTTTPNTGDTETVSKPVETQPEKEAEEAEIEPEPEKKTLFTDISSVEWAEESINALAEAGVISGMGDGTFAPSDNVTRAQFVKMIVEAFDFTGKGTASFDDIADEWYAEYVLIAANNGVVNGYDGRFSPNDNITCQDAALIVSRVLDMKGIKLEKSPADENEAAEYAHSAVALLKGNDIITDEMGFSAADKATRAQSAYLIYGAYKLK